MNSSEGKQKLLVLIGPTAVGKTRFSLELAKRLDCEIISGDSMQVYKGMDIGTAKAGEEERRAAPHHMIDIVEPDEPFSAADFQDMAQACIRDVAARKRLPFIVGGTGLYIESLCRGFQFAPGGTDEAYREELRRYADEYGDESLHARLAGVDPRAAGRIHPNDRKRVIRALEVFHLTGRPLSAQAAQQPDSPYELCMIGLTMERSLLYRRIEERVDQMMANGLAEEVRRLLAAGYAASLPSMQGLGYKEIAAGLTGGCSMEEAVSLLKRNTRRFAKRQLSWFRHMKDIRWVDLTQGENFYLHLQEIHDIIAGKFGLGKEYTT